MGELVDEVAFGDEAANRLARAAKAAADESRAQTSGRRAAGNDARDDVSVAHANRFMESAATEAGDRPAHPTSHQRSRSQATRLTATLTLIAAAAFSMTGCDGGTTAENKQTTSHAKGAVVAIVDDTASAVGGSWSVASGPAVQGCNRDSGGRGAAYFYTKMREQSAGDPAEDVAKVERLWKDKGITTERYKSGGSQPTFGVRGAGGPTQSIDFLADERGYSLDAVSACTSGNAEELQRNGE